MFKEKRGESSNQVYIVITIALIIILLLAIFVFLTSERFFKSEVEENLLCGDGSEEGECSDIQPYFCENKELIEKVGECGCPSLLIEEEGKCVSDYESNPSVVELDYVLNGVEEKIDYVVYGGVKEEVEKIERFVTEGEGATDLESFKLKRINDELQAEYLLPLVVEIQNLAEDREDQVRIAISIVQNIGFGFSDKKIYIGGFYETEYIRYPYEVLYDNMGVCGEKVSLLAFILRELNYSVVSFDYGSESHEALGIACPEKYDFLESGFCFVETTLPSIMGDYSLEYEGIGYLDSEPKVIVFSEGMSLGKDMREYEDSKTWAKISLLIKRNRGDISKRDYNKWKEIMDYYGLEVSDEILEMVENHQT